MEIRYKKEGWFTVVELEINSRCNRRCTYCPVSVLPNPDVAKFMTDTVLKRVLGELKRIDFDGRLSYHFYNEPLLRKDIVNVVSTVKSYLPNAYQVLYTNGDYLNDFNYNQLLMAGIEKIVVTRHDSSHFPVREKQQILFPNDLNLTNRGGIIDYLPEADENTLSSPCFAPSEMLIVTVTGEVVLCYEDSFRKNVFGNLLHNSLEEIWFAPDFKQMRAELERGNRKNAAQICKSCNNFSHTEVGSTWFAL